jgi:hypothetical protein
VVLAVVMLVVLVVLVALVALAVPVGLALLGVVTAGGR